MESFKDEQLLEPLNLYKDQLKDSFHNNAVEYYEKLTEKSKISVEDNQAQCKIYYREKNTADKLTTKKNWLVFAMVMTIIGIIGLVIAGVVFILMAGNSVSTGLGIGLGIGLIVAGLGLIFLAIKVGKTIKQLKQKIAEHLAKAEKAKQEAIRIIAPLMSLYQYNMAADIFTKTTPLIQLDQVFDGDKYQFLHEKYGYEEYTKGDISTVYVQSGSILGNPFVFEKNYVQYMANHVYTGTLTIHWTETVRNADGKGYHTEVRTQVLTAHYTAPEPAYYLDTWLIYGNEAAPHLSFSRKPTGEVNGKSDEQIARYVKKFDKKLDKMVAKDLNKSGSFTRMHNEEFEALFQAFDRDNETEFRLLFTPLAQKNMIALLKGDEYAFGDDFVFKKKKMLNFIKSQHMQGSDSLDRSPDSLMHFDYKVAKEMFVTYADKYLLDVYFDLAPLISIPLYQQHKTIEYIYQNKFAHNITQAEVESAANSHNVNLFKHPLTRSAGVILKSKFQRTEGDYDICTITAHSFMGEDEIAYVPVMGGDGRTHQVPVRWIRYSPIQQSTPFAIEDTKSDISTYREKYNNGQFNEMLNKYARKSDILYKKRLFSFVMKDK